MIRFEAAKKAVAGTRTECLAVGIFDEAALTGAAKELDRACNGRLRALKAAGDLPVRLGESQTLLALEGLNAARVLVVGLGKRDAFNRRAWRKVVSAALAACIKTPATQLLLAIERPGATQLDDYYLGRAVAELTGAAMYRTNDLKSARKPPRPVLQRVDVAGVSAEALADLRRGFRHGDAVAQAQSLLRDLGNLPGNVCTPRYLASRARELGKQHGKLRVRVLEEAQIRREKMGCLLAVSRGSAEPPRFIVMQYRGAGTGVAPIVLVGKGVTFDTGGISLKDPGAMDEMKYDMCGAASVMAALQFAAQLRLRVNLVGLVPAVENMPGSRATKPGDIVTSASGMTVEILNTDAEGRLILCDALEYARRFEPTALIDLATLTGACVVALGHHHTGVMANDDNLARELIEAGVRADDRAWQLPLTEEYADQLKSNFADLANVGTGRDGGAITAAAFLGRFTRGMRWAHLDIAGTAWVSGAQKGGTGRPLALLADFLLHRAGLHRS